jgi:hypothetical protein
MDKEELRKVYMRQVEKEREQDREKKPDLQWHTVEESPAGEQAQSLKRKWEELALDVALLPEKNVRLVASDKGERVEISGTMYEYFFSR